MDRRRIAVLAGIVAIFSGVGKFAPNLLLGRAFEQVPPDWVPIFGTIGITTTLYTQAVEIFGALLMIVLAVGFGYYVTQRLELRYEYRQFIRAVTVGTTVPLIVVWVAGMGAFVLGIFDGITTVLLTALVLRSFATVSLPIIFSTFAGAALAYFTQSERGSAESGEADTDTTSMTSLNHNRG